MKRVTISNLSGALIAGPVDMPDPTQWLTDGVANNWWGLPQRTKWKDECSGDELALIISEQQIEITPLIPGDPNATPPIPDTPATYRTQATLKATYIMSNVDVTSEYLKKANDAWVAVRQAQCESDVLALLNGREKTTIISYALNDIYVALNWSGTFTAAQITAAKADADLKFLLFQQIQNLMTIRDQDIAAYLAAHPVP